jgi:hypothetical protein
MDTPAKNTLSAHDAAQYIGLSYVYLAQLRMRGKGPTYHKLARKKVVYKVDDLDAWLNARRVDPQAA